MQTNAGFRKIVPNVSITQLNDDKYDFSKAYDTLTFGSTSDCHYSNRSMVSTLKNWATIKGQLYTGTPHSKGKEVENEAFRLGGLKTWGVFRSWASWPGVLPSLRSKAGVILIATLLTPFLWCGKNKSKSANGSSTWKTAMALGMGLNFSTRAGIFNFTIAAGNNFQGLPSFGTTLVHFGYLNVFWCWSFCHPVFCCNPWPSVLCQRPYYWWTRFYQCRKKSSSHCQCFRAVCFVVWFRNPFEPVPNLLNLVWLASLKTH